MRKTILTTVMLALTISQEPGGGGAAAWRISHQMDSVECLEKTDYHSKSRNTLIIFI